MIYLAVRNRSIKMQEFEAENRIRALQWKHFSALRTAGYVDIVEEKFHIAIDQILKMLRPQQLHLMMMDIIDWG